jgi:hypothetical protein
VLTELFLMQDLIWLCSVIVYHIHRNVIQKFIPNLSSKKWGDCYIIAHKVEQVLCRYFPENLNPSGVSFYMQGCR